MKHRNEKTKVKLKSASVQVKKTAIPLGKSDYVRLIKWSLCILGLTNGCQRKVANKIIKNTVDWLFYDRTKLLKERLGDKDFNKLKNEMIAICDLNLLCQANRDAPETRAKFQKLVDPTADVDDFRFYLKFAIPEEAIEKDFAAQVYSFMNIVQAAIDFDPEENIHQRVDFLFYGRKVCATPMSLVECLSILPLTKSFLERINKNPEENSDYTFQKLYRDHYNVLIEQSKRRQKIRTERRDLVATLSPDERDEIVDPILEASERAQPILDPDHKRKYELKKVLFSDGDFVAELPKILANMPGIMLNMFYKSEEKLCVYFKEHMNPDNVNQRINNDWTILHRACEMGSLQLCKILVEKGADIAMPDKEGFTPLLIALVQSHKKIVKFLLGQAKEKNIDLDLVTIDHQLNRVSVIAFHAERYQISALILDQKLGLPEATNAVLLEMAVMFEDEWMVSSLLKDNYHSSLRCFLRALLGPSDRIAKMIYDSVHNNALMLNRYAMWLGKTALGNFQLRLLDRWLCLDPSLRNNRAFITFILGTVINHGSHSMLQHLIDVTELKWQSEELGEKLLAFALNLGARRKVELLLHHGARFNSDLQAIHKSIEVMNANLSRVILEKCTTEFCQTHAAELYPILVSVFPERKDLLTLLCDKGNYQIVDAGSKGKEEAETNFIQLPLKIKSNIPIASLLEKGIPLTDAQILVKETDSLEDRGIEDYLKQRNTILEKLREVLPEKDFHRRRLSDLRRVMEQISSGVEVEEQEKSENVFKFFKSVEKDCLYECGLRLSSLQANFTIINLRQSARHCLLWSNLKTVMKGYSEDIMAVFMSGNQLRESARVKWIGERKYRACMQINDDVHVLEATAELKIPRTEGRILLAVLRSHDLDAPLIFIPVKYFPKGFHDHTYEVGTEFVGGKIICNPSRMEETSHLKRV